MTAGRPKKEIDREMFEKLCALQCTEPEICFALGVSDKPLNNWCNKEYGKNFSEVFREKKGMGTISLRRMQFELAKHNAAMAIFLGKNYLGQSDRNETIISAGNPAPERLVFDFGGDNKED